MRIKHIIMSLLCFLMIKAKGQSTGIVPKSKISNITNLAIGDKVPDFEIRKIINANKKTARITDFKNKLLIIDFWATSCRGCIEALPKMDSLQKKFDQEIKILPVTYENEKYVKAFWNRNKNTKKLSLSYVVEDEIFSAYFKHQIIPHEVWIYKGKVIGITSADYVDENNIRKVLSNTQISWPVKNDFYVFDSENEPLFVIDSNQINLATTKLRYAAISAYKEGVKEGGEQGVFRDKKEKTVRALFLNQPIYNIYHNSWMQALKNGDSLIKPSGTFPAPQNANEIVWEVIDKSKYLHAVGSGYVADWTRKNGICFESLNPDTGQTDQEVYQTVISDLNRLLGLKVNWEKRKEKVLILTRTRQTDNFKSKQALTGYYDDHMIVKDSLHRFRDIKLSTITNLLNQNAKNPYTFDETDYKGKVDLDLIFSSWTDITGIKKALQHYGLDLKEEERMVDKFIFKETDGGMLVDSEMIIKAKAKRDEQKDKVNPTVQEVKAFMDANKQKHGVIVLPSGLQYKIIKTGKGIMPSLNDKVIVHYTGSLVNGKIFESSFEQGKPIVIGVADVIKGWSEALQLMPIGSKWIIYVPAELAYGKHTNQGKLPPNSALIFEIDLLQIITKDTP